MASSGEEGDGIGEQPEDKTMSLDRSLADAKAKKRKFRPFKALRRVFKGRKRSKTSEDENVSIVSVRTAKSTSELLHVQQHGGERSESAPPLGGSLSLSADSIFSTERKNANMQELRDVAASMEQLNKKTLQEELFNKLRSKHGSSSDDDGLPSSPIGGSTTLDVFMDSSLMSPSQTSQRGLGLDHIEDDFFPKPSDAPKNDGNQDYDFEAITRTTNLANAGAKHKLSVRPKARRASTQFRPAQPKNTASILPSLDEELTRETSVKEEKKTLSEKIRDVPDAPAPSSEPEMKVEEVAMDTESPKKEPGNEAGAEKLEKQKAPQVPDVKIEQMEVEAEEKQDVKMVVKEKVVEKPVADKPVADKTVAMESVVEKQDMEKVNEEKPAAKEPVPDTPVATETVAMDPVAKEPGSEKPAEETPVKKPLKPTAIVSPEKHVTVEEISKDDNEVPDEKMKEKSSALDDNAPPSPKEETEFSKMFRKLSGKRKDQELSIPSAVDSKSPTGKSTEDTAVDKTTKERLNLETAKVKSEETEKKTDNQTTPMKQVIKLGNEKELVSVKVSPVTELKTDIPKTPEKQETVETQSVKSPPMSPTKTPEKKVDTGEQPKEELKVVNDEKSSPKSSPSRKSRIPTGRSKTIPARQSQTEQITKVLSHHMSFRGQEGGSGSSTPSPKPSPAKKATSPKPVETKESEKTVEEKPKEGNESTTTSPIESTTTSPSQSQKTSPKMSRISIKPHTPREKPNKLSLKEDTGGLPPWVVMARKREQREQEENNKDKDKENNEKNEESVKSSPEKSVTKDITPKKEPETESQSVSNSPFKASIKRDSSPVKIIKRDVEKTPESNERKSSIYGTPSRKVFNKTEQDSEIDKTETNVKSPVVSPSKPLVNREFKPKNIAKAWEQKRESQVVSPIKMNQDTIEIEIIDKTPSTTPKKTPVQMREKTPKETPADTENTPPETCSSSANARKSKVLDMVKNFQKLQVS